MVQTHAPAFFRFDYLTTKRLSNNLVPEAHSDQGRGMDRSLF